MARYAQSKAWWMIPALLGGGMLADSVYASGQQADKNYAVVMPTVQKPQDVGSESLKEILSDIARMLRIKQGVIGVSFDDERGGKPIHGKTFFAAVPAIEPDGSEVRIPGGESVASFTFFYTDVGDNGPSDEDTLTTTLPFGRGRKITFFDGGLDGHTDEDPKGRDRVLINGRRIPEPNHMWDDYRNRMETARNALRKSMNTE